MKYNIPTFEIKIDDNFEFGVDAIALVENPAIEETWIAMANEEFIKLAIDNDKQILVGAALVPDKRIYRYNKKTREEYYIVFSKETIEKIAQRFFKKGNQLNFNLEHDSTDTVDAYVFESWLVEDEENDKSKKYGLSYPTGTWVISAKVEDKGVWDEYVKTGKVKGFSIEGMFAQELTELEKTELVIEPKAGETEDEFIGRCIPYEINNGYDQEQAAAICYSKWGEKLKNDLGGVELTEFESLQIVEEMLVETYSDYPQAASRNARRAYDWAEQNGWGDCGTNVGKRRAWQLANRQPISEETIARMASFARHRQNKDVPYEEGCGGLMWDAWGGTSGILWAQRKLEQIRNKDINKDL